MMVKNTCKKRLTALIRTAIRYNHASPDMVAVRALDCLCGGSGG